MSVQVLDLRPDLAGIDPVCNHVPHVADNGSAYEQVLLLRSGDDEGEGMEHAVSIASNAFADVRICQPDSGTPRCDSVRAVVGDAEEMAGVLLPLRVYWWYLKVCLSVPVMNTSGKLFP